MSKRPILAEGSGPTLNIPQTSTIPDSGLPRSDPPLKLTTPVVPGEETIDLDKIPIPQLPKVPMTESVSSKNEDHANKEDVASSPEGEIKTQEGEKLKNSAKRQSWASTYLSSIGISHRKPIKINLSSSMKNAATVELNQSNISTEEKKPESKNSNESQQPCHSDVNINVPPSIPIYSQGSKHQIENNFKPKTDFNDIANLFIPKTNLLPYFDGIYPETLRIGNENLPYINCCSRRHHGEQPFYETSSFTEFDRYQNLSYFRPAEDKSYLDKVDQFLAKISKDKSEIESHNDIDARKRPLPLNHREGENNMKHNTTSRIEIKELEYETVRRCNDLVNKYKEYEHKEKEFLKMSRKFCDADIIEKPSTSKPNYIFRKEKSYENYPRYRLENMNFEDEYKTRENKRIQYNINRAEYFRVRSPSHVHRYQENRTYKTRQRSNSSSCSERGRSPIKNKQKTVKYDKRVKSENVKRSQNDQESTLPLQYKKSDKPSQSRERSNRSSHRNWDRSGRHIPNDDKHKPYTKSRPRSNSKSSCDLEKPRERLSYQTERSRESRGTTKRKKSNSSSDSSPCNKRTSQGKKRYKTKRESSSSSNDSDISQDKLSCQSHKNFANKKDITKKVMKETHKSPGCSENCGTRTHSDAVKCRDNKSQIREKCDKGSGSIKNKSPMSPDAKKTYKLIKDIICKDKVKRKLIKSLISHKSSINSDANDKYSKSSPASNTKQKTKILGPSEKYGTKKHNGDEESKSNQSVLIKSAVLLKDSIEQRMDTSSHEIEMDNFDLRSILSRKNLSQHINKIPNKKILEKDLQAQKELLVTLENQDQKESFETESDKLINQEKTEKLKAKKFKKIKLVINVICENSDDEDNVIEAHKESNCDNTDMDKECSLSNEELSFLDDLNIDEIVDSLTHNKHTGKKEPGSSKNCTDATIENKMLIDLCELISSTEDSGESDASTVHLEELCENNDNLKNSNRIKKGCDSSKNNVNLHNKRIDESSAKSKLEDMAQSTINKNGATSDQIELLNLNTLRKIKEEVEDGHNNDTNKQQSETKTPTDANNSVSVKQKTKEANVIYNVNEIENDLIHMGVDKEIKIEENTSEETDSKKNFSSTLKDKNGTNDNYKQNVMTLTEIKDEPMDLDIDNNTIPVIEIKDEPMDNNTVPIIEIKDEPMDKPVSREINPSENETKLLFEEIPIKEMKTPMKDENSNKQFPTTSLSQVMKNNVTYARNGNEEIKNNTPVVEVKDKSADEVQKVEMKTQKSEHELVPAIEIKPEMEDEDVNKILSYTTSPQIMINHVSYPRDENEAIMKSNSKENVNNIYDNKKEKESGLVEINNKVPDNYTFQNKSPISNIENVIMNQQNISTEAIDKFTKLNENIRNSVAKPENVVETENKSNETCTTIFSNQSTISNCFTGIADSGNLNDGDLPTPRETPLDSLNKIVINSTTDASTCTEQCKEKNAAENNALEIKPSKKINDKNCEDSKCDSPQHINTNTNINDPKFNEKKGTIININNQKSKLTEKNNTSAETETINKSRSHSPIRTTTTKQVIKTESKCGSKGKNFVQQLEDRLLQYLEEPFTVTSLIHKGKFSKVFHCKSSVGENYAIKMLRYEKDCCPRGIVKQRLLESLQMDIPEEKLNFVRAIDGLAVAGLWCILMEFYPKNLSQYLEETGRSLHVNHVQQLSRQLVAAVMVLRNKNVVHSDIKPGHVLLNSTNDRLKLCGFDGAYPIGQVDVLPNIGSVNYRAPEIILGHSAGHSVDVWSTALVMFEMATKRQLFPGRGNNDILFKQMCTLGYMPFDMIEQSRFGYNHFSGTMFRRRIPQQPYSYTLLGERTIYKNNFLRTSVNVAYLKEWAKGLPRKQKTEELSVIDNFCNLLEEMLTMHPLNRLPIEFVYLNPYMLDVSQGYCM